MALLLSFDTATKHLAVALAEDDRLLAMRVDRSGEYSHAERLNVYIDEVLRETGRTAQQLDAIAVGLGPGSYTGLRIGSSAAQGLSFGTDKPLIGMSTLDVLVAQAMAQAPSINTTDRIFPMVDARRMEVYTRAYTHKAEAIGESAAVILDEGWCRQWSKEADRLIVCGDGADKATSLWLAPEFKEHIVHLPDVRPDVQGLVATAARLWRAGSFVDRAYLVPAYGKAPAVKEPGR